MSNRRLALRSACGSLSLGSVPRVVGTLSSFPRAPWPTCELPCDIVEVRLDLAGLRKNWLDRCRAIEAAGKPVLLTLRLKSEGGKWTRPDADRLPLFERALRHLSAVDVELNSGIVSEVSSTARRLDKACIVSFHDFETTPSRARLESIITYARHLGSVIKIATMVKSSRHIATLEGLLSDDWSVPLCVIGMGPLGTPTRLSFATAGSCLTYGYLDKPAAPGQWPAKELYAALRKSPSAKSPVRNT